MSNKLTSSSTSRNSDLPKFAGRRMQREWRTVESMIRLYCRDQHGAEDELCSECARLAAFAHLRLAKCPFQEEKSTCAKCLVHCYKPRERAEMKTVMRYSGPRMLLRHPLLALMHKLDGFREPPKPPRRARRAATAQA